MFRMAMHAESYLACPYKTSHVALGVLLDQNTPVRTLPITCLGYDWVYAGVRPSGYPLLGTSECYSQSMRILLTGRGKFSLLLPGSSMLYYGTDINLP